MAGERLNGLDVGFLCVDSASAPMNIGVLAGFTPNHPVDGHELGRLLAERAARIPGLRRRVRSTWVPPGALEWVADTEFDPDAHIRVATLPAPRTGAQLADYVARAVAAPFDRDRPLWEVHVLAGLDDGGFACLLKVHHAFADGKGMFLLSSAMFDGLAPADPPPDTPAQVIGARNQVRAALHTVTRPGRWFALAGTVVGRVKHTVRQSGQGLGIAGSIARATRWFGAGSPLLGERSNGAARRQLTTVQLDGEQLRRVREHYRATLNDVLLTVIAGALREWLLARGGRPDGVVPRTLIPVTLQCGNGSAPSGNAISGYLCELPVPEPDPVRRLRAVQAAMNRNKAGGPSRGPGALPLLANLLPPQAHRIAGPLLAQGAGRLFDLVVTNVPMPDMSLRFAGAPMREIYPMVPLAKGQGLGIAISTHQGNIGIGLHSDPAIVPDIATIAHAIPAALAALDVQPVVVPSPRPKPSAGRAAGATNGRAKTATARRTTPR